jgi:hypothetical protein
VTLEERIKAAKAVLVQQAEAQGFASVPDPGPPQSYPRPQPSVPLCPVGYCHPRTAESVTVSSTGEICKRHFDLLSVPMRRQLGSARKRDEAESEKVLEQAVIEARNHDDHWAPFVILDRERVEPFEKFEPLVRRYFALVDEGLAPAVIGIRSQQFLGAEELRSYSPHTVVDVDGNVIGSGRNINDAITAAFKRCFNNATARSSWPRGEKPTVINGWTGERLDWRRACFTAAKGWKG